ncbi:MAG: helix-turn-helix domain-containing protein [Bacteroidetes bacterium]|nr:helix-turn-helix domain-containing protein [Bacteroidota bacterium]
MKHFNQFVLEKRLERELSLRQFCKLAALDASNWSKVERGLVRQGQSTEILDRISKVLDLDQTDRETLKDLAMIDSIPVGLLPEAKIVASLPIFFRTVRGEKPTEDELKQLFQTIQKANQEG